MDRHIRLLGLLGLTALAVAILNSTLAGAQAPPTSTAPVAPKSEQLDPGACAGSQETTGQGGSPDMQKPNDKSLSERLARSDGIICPPDHVGPEIRQPTPPGGAMPVIPPPGSPGGNPSLRPK
jgi:hypothetical protein